MRKNMLSNQKANAKLKSAKHLVDDELSIEYVSFGVGDNVRFVNVISDDCSDWGLDTTDFKIFKGHLNNVGRIIQLHVKDHLPKGYNLFLTVEFSDGYVAEQVTHFAFDPIEPIVIDFVKEKAKILKMREQNEKV